MLSFYAQTIAFLTAVPKWNIYDLKIVYLSKKKAKSSCDPWIAIKILIIYQHLFGTFMVPQLKSQVRKEYKKFILVVLHQYNKAVRVPRKWF